MVIEYTIVLSFLAALRVHGIFSFHLVNLVAQDLPGFSVLVDDRLISLQSLSHVIHEFWVCWPFFISDFEGQSERLSLQHECLIVVKYLVDCAILLSKRVHLRLDPSLALLKAFIDSLLGFVEPLCSTLFYFGEATALVYHAWGDLAHLFQSIINARI